MGMFRTIREWGVRQKKSDLGRIKVTSNGAFYMKAEDIFNDKKESLSLIEKLNKSLDNYTESKKK